MKNCLFILLSFCTYLASPNLAAMVANIETVDDIKLLTSQGLRLDFKDKLGRSLLHVVAAEGISTPAAAYLIGNGLNVDVMDQENETPLQLAVRAFSMIVNDEDNKYAAKAIDMIAFLANRGANVNLRNQFTEMPLHELTQRTQHVRGAEMVAQILIDKGANVNGRDQRGATPLHTASRRTMYIEGPLSLNLVPVVKTLLINGADLSAHDNQGRIPLYAMCNNTGFNPNDISDATTMMVLTMLYQGLSLENSQNSCPEYSTRVLEIVPDCSRMVRQAQTNHESLATLLSKKEVERFCRAR